MSYAIVVVEVDAGHEARVRKEFKDGDLAQVLVARKLPRDPCVRIHIRGADPKRIGTATLVLSVGKAF